MTAPSKAVRRTARIPGRRGPSKASFDFDDDLEFLLSWGTPHVEIRTRLNVYDFPNLKRRLERHQRTDLMAKLNELPPESRHMSTHSELEQRRAENDRLKRNLRVRAQFEADRARRGIPPAGTAAVHIIRTTRSFPISKAA